MGFFFKVIFYFYLHFSYNACLPMQIELTTYNLQNSKMVMLQMDVEYVIVRNLHN